MPESETEAHVRNLIKPSRELSNTSTITSTPTSHTDMDGENEKHDRPRHTSTDVSFGRTVSRRETAIARIRSRAPTGPFTHPLANVKTTAEELVDFDGPDDPYRPMK